MAFSLVSQQVTASVGSPIQFFSYEITQFYFWFLKEIRLKPVFKSELGLNSSSKYQNSISFLNNYSLI